MTKDTKNPSTFSEFFKSLKDLVVEEIDSPFVLLVREILLGKIDKKKMLPISHTHSFKGKPSHIIVYIVGGITLTESASFQKLAENFPNLEIISGGEVILNSRKYPRYA